MRTGEYFAHHAKVSTEKMEELTVKSRQETISIHVITILTLIFFSGTFVATFFSSGIIDFGSGAERLWNWNTKWGAMQLFVIVCGPLSTLVFIAWAVAYFVARRRPNAAVSNSAWDKENGG
ncbi:hypothetical protein UCREL1_5671 [Eutypa lata UCREL1]|uniref:Uncharacterized protein n=1 Tax=Eutypa lata (strain UCR-EL1) TaxID=1287681 RepID=M7SLS3_EUTLA|nr:hypothetical protein UCREL1_5671 [Eutypa lata UCREL1]